MAVPDFQSIMRPLLSVISDGLEHDVKEVKKKLTSYFSLTEDDLRTKIPSGRAFLLDNRLGWANTYLKKAGLITSARRGQLQITEVGKTFLKKYPDSIKVADLKTIDQFKEFHQVKGKEEKQAIEVELPGSDEKSPEEIVDSAFEVIENELKRELVQTVKSCSPIFLNEWLLICCSQWDTVVHAERLGQQWENQVMAELTGLLMKIS